MRLTSDEQETIAKVAKAHVRFVEFLQRWKVTELERLPKQQVNVSLFQGRAQVLMELHELLDPAAAKQPTQT